MTHVGPMRESDGDLSAPLPLPDVECPKCGRAGSVTVQIWESHDGAYEDERLACAACAHVWWIDGIDS